MNTRSGRRRPRARLSWRDWWGVLVATAQALVSDRVSMAAAGCAFFATLALFPAITSLVSIYGLVFNRQSVEPQLAYLQGLLPPPAFDLIAGRVHALIAQPANQLGVKLVVGSAITFWSAVTGTKSVLTALNAAYHVEEERSYLRFQALALVMTLSGIVGAVLAIAVLVAGPVAIAFVGLEAHAAALIHAAGITTLVSFVGASIVALYRFGPSRPREPGQRIAPGAITATLLWLVASELFTFYVAQLSNFGATYGSIGAVVGLMLWFYVTVYVVLLGAELNSKLDSRTSSVDLRERSRS